MNWVKTQASMEWYNTSRKGTKAHYRTHYNCGGIEHLVNSSTLSPSTRIEVCTHVKKLMHKS